MSYQTSSNVVNLLTVNALYEYVMDGQVPKNKPHFHFQLVNNTGGYKTWILNLNISKKTIIKSWKHTCTCAIACAWRRVCMLYPSIYTTRWLYHVIELELLNSK